MLCTKDCLQARLDDRPKSGAMHMLQDDCIECSVCLDQCPVVHAGDKDVLSINSMMQDGCINCGLCLQKCPTRAIHYEDDTARFMQDIKNGVAISLLVAPAVNSNFTDYRQLFGYFKALGVRSVHSVLLRADITIWAYVEVMGRYPEATFISSPCAAVSTYIQYHMPNLHEFLMPVYSPLVCTIIYLKKYQKMNHRLAFLSPCIAKQTEIRTDNPFGYNITIGGLKQYLAAQGVNLADYAPIDFDDQLEGKGKTLAAYGDLSACIAAHLPNRKFMKISGPTTVYNWLANYEQAVREGQKMPSLVEIYNCRAGCEGGTGINEEDKMGLVAIDTKLPIQDGIQAEKKRQEAELLFKTFNQTLCLSDFIDTFHRPRAL